MTRACHADPAADSRLDRLSAAQLQDLRVTRLTVAAVAHRFYPKATMLHRPCSRDLSLVDAEFRRRGIEVPA